MKKLNKRNAFTLVELLTVIAIIGILAGILIPTISTVKRQVAKTKTKSQFNRYSQAYASFKSEYGFFPKMGSSSDKFELKGNNTIFIETLSGRQKDGQPMEDATAKAANKRRIPFYTFEQDDFAPVESDFPGEIVDAFYNPNIVIVVDSDNDGVIPKASLDNSLSELPDEDSLNTRVAIYVVEDTDNDWEEVTSW